MLKSSRTLRLEIDREKSASVQRSRLLCWIGDNRPCAHRVWFEERISSITLCSSVNGTEMSMLQSEHLPLLASPRCNLLSRDIQEQHRTMKHMLQLAFSYPQPD